MWLQLLEAALWLGTGLAASVFVPELMSELFILWLLADDDSDDDDSDGGFYAW
jgi:hypothetical protein